MKLAASDVRNNIWAEVVILSNWKCFARLQNKDMSKRDQDTERLAAIDTIDKRRAAVEEGAAARRRGKPISANPYRYDPITYTQSGAADFALRAGWDQGWRSAIWPDDRLPIDTKDEARLLEVEKRLAAPSLKSKGKKRRAK